MAQVTHCSNAADFCSANDDENVAWDGTQFGLITGFGVEARLSEYVSLKGEYLYMRLADKNVVYKIDANSNTTYDVDFSNQSHLIRMGLNFHLNPMVIDDRASSPAWDGVLRWPSCRPWRLHRQGPGLGTWRVFRPRRGYQSKRICRTGGGPDRL